MSLRILFATRSLALVIPFALMACSSSDSDGSPATTDQGDAQSEAADDAADEQSVAPDAADEATVPDAGPEAGSPDGADDATASAFDCSKLTTGKNSGLVIDGIERSFLLDVPDDAATAGPLPVVFNWHGLGDTASNMRTLFSGAVNGPDYKFILVTPEDSAYKLSAMGQSFVLDWDAFTADEKNREVRLYDEVLSCLKTKYSVDPDRVHCAGFSIGSIVCDMIGTLRGDTYASSATYSGGYLNDPDNYDAMMAYVVKWPEYTVANRYAQLFLHGGTQDTYPLGGLITIHFDQYAIHDSAYLGSKGHDNVLCNHGKGHTAPAGFSQANLVKFLADHPRTAQQSPYRSAGLPATFPDYCEFVTGTN